MATNTISLEDTVLLVVISWGTDVTKYSLVEPATYCGSETQSKSNKSIWAFGLAEVAAGALIFLAIVDEEKLVEG